jgi:hypothetical protein
MARKAFILERGLLYPQQAKKRSRDEQEMFNATRVFARFHSAEEHEDFVMGLVVGTATAFVTAICVLCTLRTQIVRYICNFTHYINNDNNKNLTINMHLHTLQNEQRLRRRIEDSQSCRHLHTTADIVTTKSHHQYALYTLLVHTIERAAAASPHRGIAVIST